MTMPISGLGHARTPGLREGGDYSRRAAGAQAGAAQAMMSGVISSLIRWIWSLSISLRFFSRRSVSGSARPAGIERGDGVVEIPVLALQAARA